MTTRYIHATTAMNCAQASSDQASRGAEVVRAAKRLMGSQITQGLMGDYTEATEVVVNRALEVQPKTDGALFDMLHSLFGVGDFDETGAMPWFRFRIVEIAKLRAIRKRRSITLADYAMTARYCHQHHEQVKESWQVCGFIADAKREARRIAVGMVTISA
jgi:hypothetical protein